MRIQSILRQGLVRTKYLIISCALFATCALAQEPECSKPLIKQSYLYAQLIEANEHDDVGSVIEDISDSGYLPFTPEQYGYALHQHVVQLRAHGTHNFMDLAVREFVPEKSLQMLYRVLKRMVIDDQESTPTHYIEYQGVWARAFINSQKAEIVVAFRGSSIDFADEAAHFLYSWKTNLEQGFGFHSESYYFAGELVRLLKEAYPDYSIVCTGISLGGGLAHYSAAINGVQGYCFNNPLLAQTTLQNVETVFPEYSEQAQWPESPAIHHICIQDEILQDVMQFAAGKKLGHNCSIPSYDPQMGAVDRHLTKYLVKHVEAYLQEGR